MAQDNRRPQSPNSASQKHASGSQQQPTQGRNNQGRNNQGRNNQVVQRGQQSQDQNLQANLMKAVTPAFQEVRNYIEGRPIRAAAIGAIAGGALMTLFSTEKGRAFVKAAYDYANPMLAKYAREYISKAAGDMAESAIAH